MSLTAIGPDLDAELSGFQIKLTAQAREGIAEIAQATREQLEDATLLAYGPAVQIPPQHWMYVTEDEAATLASVMELLQRHDLKPFDSRADYARNLKMLAARFTTVDQRRVTFFRIADSMLQFKKSKFLGLLQVGDVYDRLESADVLLLRTNFDVLAVDGFAFFTKSLRSSGPLASLRRSAKRVSQRSTR